MLLDANVLLYAVHRNSRFHERARDWLTDQLNGSRRVGFPWQSLAAFRGSPPIRERSNGRSPRATHGRE